VQVSLDGLKEQHEALRGSGTYERALRALKFLLDAGARAGILCVLSTLNDRSIPEFIDLLTSLNIRDIGFERLTPLGRSSRLKRMALSPDRLKSSLRTIYLLKKQHPEFEINVNDPLKVHMDTQVQRMSRGKHTPTGGCFAGGLGCTISPNGDIRPCTRLAYTAGNLLKADFSTIWNDSGVLRTLRDRRKWSLCGACRYRDACGGCRAESLASCGNMFDRDPGCWLTAKERSRANDKGSI
jgi:radical SAM protein with 4Fe4S-binding SPASM domain